MISPINSTSLYSKSLEPVKVPHFSGKSRTICQTQTKTRNQDTVAFKKQVQRAAKAAKKGFISTCGIIKDGIKKTFNFLKEFTKSLYEDARGIAQKHCKNKLTKADGIVENLLT